MGEGKGMRGNAGSRQGSRIPNRRSIRMPGYDYAQAGAYFVTICTKDRKFLFADIVNREMALNNAGRGDALKRSQQQKSHSGKHSDAEKDRYDFFTQKRSL